MTQVGLLSKNALLLNLLQWKSRNHSSLLLASLFRNSRNVQKIEHANGGGPPRGRQKEAKGETKRGRRSDAPWRWAEIP
jgi:hypothetical protein